MKSVIEVFREFLILGLSSFGGPTAHIAFFRDRFVERKKWLTEADFADLLALCQFLPGPASSQFGLSIGWKRAGWAGAFAAWVAFTVPSALLLILFGLGVMKYGGGLEDGAGWLKGLQIAVVAVIAGAVTSMWKTLCTDRPRQLLALAAATILLGTGIAWMQLVVIALGAVAGWFLFRGDQTGLNEGPDRIESSTEKSSAQQSSAQQAVPSRAVPSWGGSRVRSALFCFLFCFSDCRSLQRSSPVNRWRHLRRCIEAVLSFLGAATLFCRS